MATTPQVPNPKVKKAKQNPHGRPKGVAGFKALLRMEKAVRLELMNLGDKEIADHIHCGVPGLRALRRRPEYQLLKQELATGVISDYHAALKEDTQYIRSKLRAAVPKALELLVEAANIKVAGSSPQHLRLAIEASKTILNRDGRFAEVSRIGLPTEDQGGVASVKDNNLAMALAQALASQRDKEVAFQEPDINSEPASEKVQ